SGRGRIKDASPNTIQRGMELRGGCTLATSAGTNTLTATSSGLSPLTFTATGAEGEASSLVIAAGNNQSAPVGTAVATPPAVLVRSEERRAGTEGTVPCAAASGGGTMRGE